MYATGRGGGGGGLDFTRRDQGVKGRPPEPNRLFFLPLFIVQKFCCRFCILPGANIRNIIRIINVHNEGRVKGRLKNVKKKQTIWRAGTSLGTKPIFF